MRKILKTVLCVFKAAGILSVSVFGLSKMGSRSEEVRKIQQVLKEKGYYDYTADGIFGTRTRSAVVNFQKDNGLSADGIAGEQTLKALGISGTDSSYGGYSSADYDLLARIISAEARGESYLGQVAVGAVILNRIEHPSFPDTLSGVIYQKNAFTCINDGQCGRTIRISCVHRRMSRLIRLPEILRRMSSLRWILLSLKKSIRIYMPG